MNRLRREFLRHVGGAGLAALAGTLPVRPSVAQSQRSAGLALTDLGGGLAVVTGAGGNVVVHSGREGLLLVDSGGATSATALQAFLAERFGSATIGVLFNTHWHLDHTGGNDALVGGRS